MYSYGKQFKLEEDITRDTPTIQLDGTDEEYVYIEVYLEDNYIEFRKHKGDPVIDLVRVKDGIEMEILNQLHDYIKGLFE